MIEISEVAAQQIVRTKQEEKRTPTSFLRISVKAGGCSGMTYDLSFDDSKGEKDKTFAAHGVEVVVDTKSYLYILGSTLDFSGGLNGKGFFLTNPNAKKSCGCGTSFSV